MKIPVGQALNALAALQKMLSKPFPAKEAFLVAKVSAKLSLNPDITACDTARNAAVRRYGIEHDGQITVPPEKMLDFAAEFQPVAMEEIELDIAPLPLSILDHAPDMTPADMLALEPFLEEPK